MLLAGVLVVLVVLAVVLFAGGSSDDPELKVINGAAAAGFPLRGDLARDSKAIQAAADAWLAHDGRQAGDSGVLDNDGDVEMRALWAGRLRDTKTVMLAGNDHAALVEVEPDDAASVQAVVKIRAADDPRVVVFDRAVLVDTKADPTFMSAVVRGPDVAPRDGLWVTTGPDARPSLPAGALVLRGGLLRSLSSGERTPPAAVIHSNPSSTWLIDATLQIKLVPGSQAFSPQAHQRLVAATTAAVEGENAGWNPISDPPELRFVQDLPLPVLGTTMVLTAQSRTGRNRVLAARGGSLVAGKDAADPLGLADDTGDDSGDNDNAGYGVDGPAFAAAIIDRGTPEDPNRDLSVFVAGSSQIETIEVLTGRERVTRPGPVAVVPLPAPTGPRAGEPARPRGDLAVLGRTRAGTLVVPSGIRAR